MGISTNPATASESIPRSLSSHVSLNCGAGGTKRNVSIMYGAGGGGGEDDIDGEVQKLNWPPRNTERQAVNRAERPDESGRGSLRGCATVRGGRMKIVAARDETDGE